MLNDEEEFLEDEESKQTKLEEEPEKQPVEKKLASKDSAIQKETSKLAKDLLKKNPYTKAIILGIIVLIFFILIILMIVFDFDLVGTGDVESIDYPNSFCSSINISSTNTTLDLEDYVARKVYDDNENANDVDNEVVYQAMAIAIRSQVTATLSEDCTINEEVTKLSGIEPNYEKIMEAVKATSGLIIAKDNQAINALYDPFSYVSKDKGFYYMMNKNEAGEQWIPANWVEEQNIPTKKVLSHKTLSSLSLYGAKYLLEKADSQYDLYRILEEYYGRDIEYFSISSKNFLCSDIDFYKTPLTKEEFVSRLKNYLQGKNSTTARLFIEHAEDIYDWGLEVGANPEMVVITAQKEQQWNDTSFTVRCNNFYGMGVYNGQSSGMCFDSFKDGVVYMLNYIKQKGSLDAYTKVYSYLGTYLANPGSWGDGGCIYLTMPDIFGPNYSRCNAGYSCPSSNGGAGCVLTTEAEKQAYIDWQGKIILEYRSNIFQINSSDCENGIEGSTDGATLLNESIESFLAKNGSSLAEFNDVVLQQGCKYKGTGQGVAYVAATAVSELAKYGKKFNYVWGGMHTSAPESFGVPANWGIYGPDCSGFVSWALYNAGFEWKSLGATAWGGLGEVVSLDDNRIKVGDFIVTPGNRGWNHIVIITAIHADEGYYNVVEASSTRNGVIFSKVNINKSNNRKAVLMSNYYESAPKSIAYNVMCTARSVKNGE